MQAIMKKHKRNDNDLFLDIIASSFSVLKIHLDFMRKGEFKKSRGKKLQMDFKSPWISYIGCFWEIHFITTPKRLRVG
jgi:hypothetical protein